MATRPRVTAVSTPGQPQIPDDPVGAEAAVDAMMADAADLDDGAGGGPEAMVTLTKGELARVVDAAASKAVRAMAIAQATPGSPDKPLPDQSEIDPAKIKRPMLSKQGYVIPLDYGVPAAAIKRD